MTEFEKLLEELMLNLALLRIACVESKLDSKDPIRKLLENKRLRIESRFSSEKPRLDWNDLLES